MTHFWLIEAQSTEENLSGRVLMQATKVFTNRFLQ